MIPDYLDTHHWHIGYYQENLPTIEATAFQRTKDNYWDVYFNFEEYGLKVPIYIKDEDKWDEYGYKIMTVQKADIDEEEMNTLFSNWLKQNCNHRFG
ncbi:DUF3986 family protein [Salinithrix halophila]|uniref:DUF3986 family protein n=1 Tax=Salinithrix halophila TaxID=1485204 RepID=A0ABV8JI43_9BACL